MQSAVVDAIEPVLSAEGGKCREFAVHGNNRQAVFGNALVWVTANGAVHATTGTQMWTAQGTPIDAPYAVSADLSGAKYQQEAPAAQDLPLSAADVGN